MNMAVIPVRSLPVDDRRGTGGMALFILTEAMLFLMFFFSYYYLGRNAPVWPPEPPKLHYALPMLAVLLGSSVVLWWAEHTHRQGDETAARWWVGLTIALGVLFLVLQFFEYREHLRTLRPTSNAYGSIFYTITSFHGMHVVLGLFMLAYVLVLPRLEPAEKPPHRPMRNASLYWHFVDTVWVFIVALLYVVPNLTR